MGYAITEEQNELAVAVAKFAQRHAPMLETREQSAKLIAGAIPEHWGALVDMGIPALFLPEEVGGQGATIEDLAAVVEELGSSLYPGPFLPTVIASGIIAQAGAEHGDVLERFAQGATGALLGGVVKASLDGSELALDGESEPSIGALSAELMVVPVDLDSGGLRWAVVDAGQPGVTREEGVSTDRTRDAGTVRFDRVRISASAVLEGLEAQTVETVRVSLLAAEAAGIMRWAATTATDYAKIREQFGQQIGAFQAIKHKCAHLFVRSELATAAAWGAATSLTQDFDQQRLATNAAAITAIGESVDAVMEAVTVFGGIGFTWEHDAHLYMRRAIALAAVTGPTQSRTESLGEAALTHERVAEIELPGENAAFRAEVGVLLDEASKLESEAPGAGWATGASARGPRREFLATNGLATPHWPKPFGLGAGPTQQIIISQEFAKRDMVQPNTIIGEWAVPTILSHGTDAQRERFAPATARGEIEWCQLFSEPGAGSDLAGLSTRAVKVEGGWRMTGQKVWTSGAHTADWGICLARTDFEVPKHKGISFFLVDMRSEGVDVRPLTQSTGDAHFNEVFLDEVFVPDDLLVGEPGNGWRITATTLGNERTSMSSSMNTGTEAPLRNLILSGEYVSSRETALQVFGDIVARSISVGALSLRETLRRLNGLQPGAGSSVGKVASAALHRSAGGSLVSLVGPVALFEQAPEDAVIAQLGVPAQLLGGGTVEIQLNVIAERILQLPR